MNLIVFTHFVTPMQGASYLEAALDNLGVWFDAEIDDLEDLLDITGHEEAIDEIEALHKLHLNANATPEDVRRLLEAVQPPLERLLERVRTILLERLPAGSASSDFNAWVYWSRARLEDILATLRQALAA